jgi:hypothetical protein
MRDEELTARQSLAIVLIWFACMGVLYLCHLGGLV